MGDHLDIEIGATHPAYYYALFNCDSINSCFQDLLYLNAGYTSYKFSVPGANFAYQVTPTVYAQAGVFANQQNANDHVGYDFGSEKYNGVLGMGEIGSKTTFATNPYPYSVSVTGFFTTQDHVDYNAATAYNGVTRISNGTSGIVVQADKVVWRRDGGADPTNVSPTALKFYTSIGTAIDSTTPIQSDIWVGATLLSPFVGRPADRFGLKFNWERLNPSYTQYLTAANAVSGGPRRRVALPARQVRLRGQRPHPAAARHGVRAGGPVCRQSQQLLQPADAGEGSRRRLSRRHLRHPDRRHPGLRGGDLSRDAIRATSEETRRTGDRGGASAVQAERTEVPKRQACLAALC